MKNKDNMQMSKEYHQTDVALFKLISERNAEALERLFNKYYEGLCRFGTTYESDLAIVEEKVSDVFIQLWNTSPRKLLAVKNPKPYLYVVVKNKLLEPVKHQQVETSLQEIHEHNSSSPCIEDEIIYQEQKAFYAKRIAMVLDKIPEKSRQIFEMSRLDELKHKEISEILGVSIKTVENHMSIALRTIRNMIIKQKQY